MEQVKLVGLTGSIAAGKSEVSKIFSDLGAAVIDADILAREVVAPGSETLQQIVAAFGPGILDRHGALDRKTLGNQVFSDAAARRQLESITHRAIVAASKTRVDELGRQGKQLVLYEAPLLVETGRYREMDCLVVVVADDGKRLDRLMRRDQLSREDAAARIAAQLPQEQKTALADHLIDNSGSLGDTRWAVQRVWDCIQEDR